MTAARPDHLTAAQLVERFAAIGIEQGKAVLSDDNAKFTRLYWQMEAVEEELKRRPGDKRRELLTLFNHPNMQVRLMAAKAALPVAPETARRVLEAIAASHRQPQAGDAGMSLSNLDRGVFVPK
jgi:hypothetical protein